MEIEPENQDQESKTTSGEAGNDSSNEDIAKEIPTVTPDRDNLEPGPNEDNTKDE
jgi:hypothetical protein